ncbi:glycosyltransferase family 2 protein [Pedobacter heparinus]|uniref:Glycosyl transferase family 2 n=1 Tax=Pedobacter heparinus (strain ATCC 13125 / DSM 2366 / CIP 104194 / JCM 7457 / NBRC 12017 / NCIMB 9290 / NRRL B-14731 / HIM 762-3) TaxID=485917 RepID=C6XW91_PEDHD|nr:glycosyltransferase family 2 protein [Pedobacter heparinus]ACU04170.1 glycosyl transferase family 2 [Pedobacter heparinus DSM 2366]
MNLIKSPFDEVTLLITHYNRSRSLERLLQSFSDYGTRFYDIIVSDDGSKSEHISYITELKKRFDFQLLLAEKNRGLGNNINKGQEAVKSEFTLYVQEDFVPLPGFEKPLADGLSILKDDPSADTVRFYSYLDYPQKKYYRDGFSEMIFDPFSLNLHKFPLYSDHPHLRRSNFLKKFGKYNENKHSDKTEFEMMLSFIRNKGKGYLYNDYKSVFDQVNDSFEPSTVHRVSWRASNNLLIKWIRYIYRQISYNYSLYIK